MTVKATPLAKGVVKAPKKAKAAPAVERPTSYSPEGVAPLLERIANSTDGLRKICSEPGMPAKRTVYDWLARHEDFQKAYAAAKLIQADGLVEEAKEILDDGSADYKLGGKDGAEIIVDHEHITRSRARADHRKWMASKLAPKVYGDTIKAEVTGRDGAPLTDDTHAAARIAAILAAAAQMKAAAEPE